MDGIVSENNDGFPIVRIVYFMRVFL